MIKPARTIFILLLCVTAAAFAADPVTSQQLEKVHSQAVRAFDDFLAESFLERMHYEYNDQWLNAAASERLEELAEKAAEEITELKSRNRDLLETIANCEAENWHQLYIETGLWNQVRQQQEHIELMHYEIDTWHEISAGRKTDLAPLRKKLSEFDKLERALLTADDNFEQLVENLAKSDRAGDYEIVLRLAFAWRKSGQTEAFSKITDIWPAAGDYLGKLVLERLSRLIEQNKSIYGFNAGEIELAAKAAWSSSKNHTDALAAMLDYRDFRRPIVLYAAAADYADDKPEYSIELLIEACQILDTGYDKMLQMPSREIAGQAAKMAAIYPECDIAYAALDNYLEIAGDDIENAVVYPLIQVLKNCGDESRWARLTRQIAADGLTDKFSAMATLDLFRLEPDQYEAQEEKLKEMIAVAKSRDWPDVTDRAKITYAELLADTGRADEAVVKLAGVTNYSPLAAEILTAFVRDFERHFGPADKSREHAAKINLIVQKIIQKGIDFCPVLTLEIHIIAQPSDSEKINTLSRQLDALDQDTIPSADLLRTRARIAAATEQPGQSAKLWAELAQIHRSSERNWHWWRAKYYELHQHSQTSAENAEQSRHAATVLLRSSQKIPNPWQELLEALADLS